MKPLATVVLFVALAVVLDGCGNAYINAVTPGANQLYTDAQTGLLCATATITTGCDTIVSQITHDAQALEQILSSTTPPPELGSDAQLLMNDTSQMLALDLTQPISWNDGEDLAQAMQNCIADMNATEGNG